MQQQEMYAFSVASSQLAAGPVKYSLVRELMIQPPWDEQLTAANGKDAYILHYTYGQDCDESTGTPLTDKVRSVVHRRPTFANAMMPLCTVRVIVAAIPHIVEPASQTSSNVGKAAAGGLVAF